MSSKFYPIRLSELWYFDENNNIVLFSDNNLSLNHFNFNLTGSFIWVHCTGKLSNLDIAELLYNDLEEDDKPSLSELILDVNEYLNDLRHNSLVNWANEDELDVLFVVPPFPAIYSSKAIETPEYSAPPLGVAYLAAVLKQNEFKVSIFDMHINASQPECIIDQYRKYKPKIIAITTTTPTFPNALRVAKLLKAWDSNITIIMGGPHPTSLPEECLSSDAVDFLVIGEGEITTLNLVNAILRKQNIPQNIKGIAFKDNNGQIIFTKEQKRLSNLDSLLYPARDLLNMDLYYQKGSIISSRGCPYNCNYCSCSVIAGHTYRTHSVDYVLDEIEYLIKTYNYKFFDFHDDTFNLIPKRVIEFCDKISERNLDINWGCFCRVNNFTYDMALNMKNAGCEVIQFGVEAGNQIILNSIKKKITLEEVENAVKAAHMAGIKQIVCGFIIGHADDTEETANQTIDFGAKLAKLGATRLTISVLTPYPGTDVYINKDKYGIKLITEDWEQYIFSRVVLETENLSKDKLREIYTKGVYKFLEATI